MAPGCSRGQWRPRYKAGVAVAGGALVTILDKGAGFATLQAQDGLSGYNSLVALRSRAGATKISHRAAVGEQGPRAGAFAACACLAAGGLLSRRRPGRQSSPRSRLAAGLPPGAGGAIETFMVRGPVDPSKLAVKCSSLPAYFDLECVVFFCCGVKPEVVASVAGGSLGLHGACPIYIAETKGVVGWDPDLKANAEIQESDGTSGVVVVAFRGGCHEPSVELDASASSNLPEGRALHLVVRSSAEPSVPATGTGVIYGGLATACYELEHSGDLSPVVQFAVSTPFAVLASFSEDPGKAASVSLGMLPEVASPPIAAGYFSSLGRKHGEEDGELSAFVEHGLGQTPLFGMLSEDTMGPPASSKPIPCVPELTEWTSILDADPRPEIVMADDASLLALYGK